MFFSFLYLTNARIQTLEATKTGVSPVCLKCGAIAKSGGISCCGRGGSWFRNCGGAGNSNLEHTWHEGIRACKTRARSKAAIGQQLNAAQQLKSSNGAGTRNSKAVITAAKTFEFRSVNPPTQTPRTASTNTLIPTPDSISTGYDTGTAITTTIATTATPTMTTTIMMAATTMGNRTVVEPGSEEIFWNQFAWVSKGMCYPLDVCVTHAMYTLPM